MGSCGSKKEKLEKSKTYTLQVLHDHQGGINCMALSDDGSVLVTGSEDKTARLWSTRTYECECIGILQGHDGYITCVLIEEHYVLTGSSDSTIRKWDISTCECVNVYRGHKSVIYRMICTGDFIFTSSYDRTCLCWDFDTADCVRVFSGHKRGVYPLIFIPADEDSMALDAMGDDLATDILITGSADFTARTWNFETGKCMKVFKGHTGAVTCMATDPLGKILFTGSTDQTVKSWNLYKGDCLKTFEGHTASVICLQIVNKIMYTASSDHTGRSWVTEFGDCTRVYKGHKHTVSCIKYHEGLLITGCGDGICRVYDAKTGTSRRVFKGPADFAINSLQIVDGKLFTGSHDGCIRVWDITGIRDDAAYGARDKADKEKDKDKMKEIARIGGLERVDSNQNGLSNGDSKIMIDDDDGYGYDNQNRKEGMQSRGGYHNGGLTLDEKSRERAVLEMV